VIVDVVKAGLLLTLAATAQLAIVNAFELVDGRADLALLCLVGLALLRGPIFGAAAGFFTGLVLDMGMLGTLGLSSLLLTLAGYWAGRFGEATSNDKNQSARILIAVALTTVGVAIGALVIHLLLGESIPVGPFLVRALLPSLALNLILAIPVYVVCRWLFPPPERKDRGEVVVV
jgi:rod shape-determining protein MreD